MGESERHKVHKQRHVGSSGQLEVPLKLYGGQGARLDVVTPLTAKGIELSGDPKRLEYSAKKLRQSRKPSKQLIVPHEDMLEAAERLPGGPGAIFWSRI